MDPVNYFDAARIIVELGLLVAAVTPTEEDDKFFGRAKNLLSKMNVLKLFKR